MKNYVIRIVAIIGIGDCTSSIKVVGFREKICATIVSAAN